MVNILIVDDDLEVRETMASLVRRQGLESDCAENIRQAMDLASGKPYDVIFLDVRLPDGNGLDMLPRFNSLQDPPEVIILTGKGDPDGAELAMQQGVWDYLLKPSSVKEISLSLKRALSYRKQKRERDCVDFIKPGNVVGESPAFRALFEKAAMACRSEASVLITGETGTGKELFARLIHENSGRAEKSFVVVDCAALPPGLVESTLFGHRKGAFTSAHNDQPGLVKLADKGTLFLDEAGEMPLSLQKSFLRVLQERRYRPVGETREVTSNFRLISATNKDLEAMVQTGDYREDLLFRLKTIHLRLPTLRERGEDITHLTTHYMERLSHRYQTRSKSVDPGVFNVLYSHDWPGNVRELFNVLERAFVTSGSEPTLYAKHLSNELRVKAKHALLQRSVPKPVESGESGVFTQALRQAREEPSANGSASQTASERRVAAAFAELVAPLPTLREAKHLAERQYLERILATYGSDVAKMVEVSGLSRSHFYALLKKYGIRDL